MCTKEEFARLRDQTAANSMQISQLVARDAAQSEQIKTLFATTEKQGKTIDTLTARLVMAIVLVLVILVLAVVFGALGERGFNAVTKAAPTAVAPR